MWHAPATSEGRESRGDVPPVKLWERSTTPGKLWSALREGEADFGFLNFKRGLKQFLSGIKLQREHPIFPHSSPVVSKLCSKTYQNTSKKGLWSLRAIFPSLTLPFSLAASDWHAWIHKKKIAKIIVHNRLF